MEEQRARNTTNGFLLVFNSEEARHAQKNGPPEIIILLLQPHLIVWASGDRLQACSLNRRRSAERARIIILLIPPHLLIKGVHYRRRPCLSFSWSGAAKTSEFVRCGAAHLSIRKLALNTSAVAVAAVAGEGRDLWQWSLGIAVFAPAAWSTLRS